MGSNRVTVMKFLKFLIILELYLELRTRLWKRKSSLSFSSCEKHLLEAFPSSSLSCSLSEMSSKSSSMTTLSFLWGCLGELCSSSSLASSMIGSGWKYLGPSFIGSSPLTSSIVTFDRLRWNISPLEDEDSSSLCFCKTSFLKRSFVGDLSLLAGFPGSLTFSSISSVVAGSVSSWKTSNWMSLQQRLIRSQTAKFILYRVSLIWCKREQTANTFVFVMVSLPQVTRQGVGLVEGIVWNLKDVASSYTIFL